MAPHLLPLLAEPARSAFHGLSVLNRGSKPHLVVAFLQVSSSWCWRTLCHCNDWGENCCKSADLPHDAAVGIREFSCSRRRFLQMALLACKL